MNNPRQHRSWILGMCGRAAGAVLALAIMLVPAILAGSAQAQTYSYSLLYAFTGPPDGARLTGGCLTRRGTYMALPVMAEILRATRRMAAERCSS